MRRLTYLLLAGSLLLTASCKKYLNTVPDDVLTIDDIFSSKANVDAYLANIYSTMPNEMQQRFPGSGNSGVWEGASDDAKFNWDFVYTNQMNLSVWSNTDGNVETYWGSYYKAIRNATDFMNRIDKANAAELSPQLITEYKAEARGLRALYYFFLLRTYGPVVLLGDNLISADASTESVRLPRASFDAGVDFVVKQLDSAYTDLPASPSSNSQLGRLVKGVVKAYKEQVLFLAASPLYNGNTDYAGLRNQDGAQLISQTYDVNKWKLAADAAKAFLSEFGSSYHLYTESDPDPAKAAYLSCKNVMLVEWNPEWIFARPNSGSYMRYDKTPKHAGGPSDQTGAGAMGVTQTMVDAYFMSNGLPIDDPGSGYVSSGFSSFQSPSDAVLNLPAHSTFNQWVNREPRFYVGVTYDSSRWLYQDPGYATIITAYQFSGSSGRSQSTSDVSPTGYTVRKNVAPNDNDRGALLLRLANIYLDYAEALNEYDPGNPDILTYLNMIRQRADVPVYGSGGLPAPASQADMRTAIRKERRVELAFENVRYFDTRRWKIAPQTDAGPFYGMNMYVNGADFYKKTLIETRIFQFRDYLFPIPMGEILKDNLLVQNPGW